MKPETSCQRSAVAYIRASTEDQVNTLEVQREKLAQYCAYKGIHLAEVFIDAGVSGSEELRQRPEGRAMLDFMEATGIHEIIFTTIDRVFRRTADAMNTFAEWREQGIECHALDMDIDTGTATGRLILGMRSLVAEYELDIRAERQGNVIQSLRTKSRRIGEIPYGYLGVPDVTLPESRRGNIAMRLIPDPEEQAVLEMIYDWADKGHAPHAIARELNRRHIPAKKGGKWHAIVIASLIERRPENAGAEMESV